MTDGILYLGRNSTIKNLRLYHCIGTIQNHYDRYAYVSTILGRTFFEGSQSQGRYNTISLDYKIKVGGDPRFEIFHLRKRMLGIDPKFEIFHLRTRMLDHFYGY